MAENMNAVSLPLCCQTTASFRKKSPYFYCLTFFNLKRFTLAGSSSDQLEGLCNYHIRRLRTQAPHLISIAYVLNLSHGF